MALFTFENLNLVTRPGRKASGEFRFGPLARLVNILQI